MYTNKATINTTADANGGSYFIRVSYWSSTERDNHTAWSQIFDNGYQSSDPKSYAYPVRAVRAF